MFPRNNATVATAVAASVLALAGSASADAQVRADLSPGDVVRDHGVGVLVPPPGHATYAEATLASGGAETLAVLTERDGTVVVSGAGSEAAEPLPELAEMLPKSPPDECDDGAYRRLAFTLSDGSRKFAKWKTILNWWFHPAGVPSEIDPVRAREAVRRAVRNVVTGRNECGMADQVSATQDFQSDTATPSGVSPDGMCGVADAKNVVGFGSLGARSGAVGVVCMRAREDGGTYLSVDEIDVKFNTDYLWYADLPTICLADRYSIEGVGTHEFGHAYGLDHVDEAGHGELTMSTNVNATCRDEESTLGKGDVWGLQSLY